MTKRGCWRSESCTWNSLAFSPWTTAPSAREALRAIAENDYDTVISDFQMPGMSGIEMLRKLRAAGSKVPFILYTGQGREEVAIEALDAGVTSYVQKGGYMGITFAELEHKVRAHASHYRSERILASLSSLKERLQGDNTMEGRLKMITDGASSIFGVDLARIWVIRPGDRCAECPNRGGAGEMEECSRTSCLHMMASSGTLTPAHGYFERIPLGLYDIAGVEKGERASYVSRDVTTDPEMSGYDWSSQTDPLSMAAYRIQAKTGAWRG